MKIALYIEPYKINHNTFYNNVLMKEEFEKRGFVFDIFTPQVKTINRNEGTTPFKMSNDYGDFYKIQIYDDFPKPTDYDILFVYEDNCKKWNKTASDMRNYLSDKFLTQKKQVACLKFDTIIEYRLLHPISPIIYGICSDKLTYLSNQFNYIVKPSEKRFIMPVIGNLKHPKPNALSKEELMELYGLDKNKKIIAYLPGKIAKWNSKNYSDLSNYHENFRINIIQAKWFQDNFNKIVDYFSSQGYQLVGKLHARDSNKFLTGNSELSKDYKIKYVDQYHSYELMKYSDFAITFGTTMVYQLYLYQLPTLEIGTGIYYPSWSINDFTQPLELLTPLASYNFGRDLIYGQIVAFDKLINNPSLYLKAFLLKLNNGGYSIDNFPYKNNNPIYGNSFDSSIPKIVDVITKSLNIQNNIQS
jgi:hypothetical protein